MKWKRKFWENINFRKILLGIIEIKYLLIVVINTVVAVVEMAVPAINLKEVVVMDDKEKEIFGKYQFWKNNSKQHSFRDKEANICICSGCGGCRGR